MAGQDKTVPVSQADTVLFILEQTADKLAAISHMFMADEPLPDTAKRGAVEFIEDSRRALYEATDHCEAVREYLEKRAKRIELSMTEMLKDWVDKADDETRKNLVLSFCKAGQDQVETSPKVEAPVTA